MIYTLGDKRLETAGEDFYIAPGARVIGGVRLGRGASIWFNCVVRGDDEWITLGDGANIQDGTIIHVDVGLPTELARDVSVGHQALVHACTIGEETLIGNGAVILDRARIGRRCLIAAGALVPPGKVVPDDSVVMGVPGKVVRDTSEEDLALIRHTARQYQARAKLYRELLIPGSILRQ